MGIQVEFNPDLALRNISEFKEEGKVYSFLKEGQRCYWLEGELPLLETKGGQNLSEPKASVIILEATHLKEDGKTYTKGRYKVVKVLAEGEIYFNGINKI